MVVQYSRSRNGTTYARYVCSHGNVTYGAQSCGAVARHGHRSILITSNLAFGEWPRVFGGDEKLATALLDRLGEQATVITPKGKSYRMRRRKGGQDGAAATAAITVLLYRARKQLERCMDA